MLCNPLYYWKKTCERVHLGWNACHSVCDIGGIIINRWTQNHPLCVIAGSHDTISDIGDGWGGLHHNTAETSDRILHNLFLWTFGHLPLGRPYGIHHPIEPLCPLFMLPSSFSLPTFFTISLSSHPIFTRTQISPLLCRAMHLSLAPTHKLQAHLCKSKSINMHFGMKGSFM